MAYSTTFVSGPITFGFDTTPPPPTAAQQNKKLRDMALDNLLKEIDAIADAHRNLSNQADRAAAQLRQLRPLLPAEQTRTGKRKNR